MGLGRGDASGNGTWICDIAGYKLGIEIQLQRIGNKNKTKGRCLGNRRCSVGIQGNQSSQQTIHVA